MNTSDEGPKGRARLTDRIALVCGGGSIGPGWGNGKAAAVLYGREGAKVFVVDSRIEAAEETAAIIRTEGGTAAASACDVTRESDVAAMIAKCLETFGRIDVLHNNVGGQGTGRRIDNITLDDWNQVLATNLTSVMLTCREIAPLMEKQGGGAIVNISSISSIRHLNAPTAVYSAAKGGVNEFTKNIAMQLAPKGIRLNCVLPGYIDTPFIRRLVNGKPSYAYKGYASAEEYGRARDMVIPLRRMGTGWDVASASIFLASDEASYITGQMLIVDGGVTQTCPGA